MIEATYTHHCKYERAQRIANIIKQVGIGQIVKKDFINECYICITDTGVTIIKNADETKIITMYITTYKELVRVYKGEKKIPDYLKKKVNRNQSKYIHDGKTIL